MTYREQRDIVILGGGIAGLTLAYFLCSMGFSCSILDGHLFAGFASSRNQGWLQSGAAYIMYRQLGVPEECWDGYNRIIQFAETTGTLDALARDIPAYMLFEHSEARDELVRGCEQRGIPAENVSIDSINSPLLSGSPLRYAVRTPDCPVETTRILEALVREINATGLANWVSVDQLNSVAMTRWGTGWNVSWDNGDSGIECASIVLATGALIPELLSQLDPHAASAYQATKITVGLLQDPRVAGSMLLTPGSGTSSPNLVPFRSGVISGATFCLQNGDVPIRSASDFAGSPADPTRHAEQLNTWFPGFRTMAQEYSIPTTYYTCQKLQRIESRNRSAIMDSLNEHLAGIHVWYPSKFTSAIFKAEMFAATIRDQFSATRKPFARSHRSTVEVVPQIAKRPYGLPSTHDLSVTQRGLQFSERPIAPHPTLDWPATSLVANAAD